MRTRLEEICESEEDLDAIARELAVSAQDFYSDLLETCRRQFQLYVYHHESNGNHEKAEVNRAMVQLIEEVKK